MGDPPTHDDNKKKKNKNGKSMPLAINIGAGAGCLGIGGIVLLGGALVTATLVSALAIKTRRQRRSSSDAINNTKTVDEPNQLELMMKNNESSQDFSLDSSSDWATGGTKEMQDKPNQILTPDENQNSGVDRDEKVDSGDGIFSVVGEDQESTWIYVDPVSETEQVDNGYEKIALDCVCEQQLVVATQTELVFPSSEEDSCSEILDITAPRDDNGEEQKYPMLIDDSETEKSLVSIEAVTLIKEYEAVKVEESVLIGDDVAEEIPTGDVVEDQETVFMNEKVAFLEKIEKDGHDEMIPKNCEGDLIDETAYPDSIVNELVMREESKIEVEDNLQVQFLQEEKEEELVKKDEIPHVRSIEEAKNSEEDASKVSSDGIGYSSMQEEVIPEAKISNHKTEENTTIVSEDQNDNDHNRIMKEGKSASKAASEPWNLKLWTCSLLASIWCICHCYFELPFPEVSLVGSLLFIFMLLCYRKRTKYSVKYE